MVQCIYLTSTIAMLLIDVSMSLLVYPSTPITHLSSRRFNRYTALTYMTHDDIVETVVDKPQPSKRAKRKAAQRAKKQQKQKQQSSNKATSLHPEAIIKRNKKQQPPTSSQSKKNSRRKHNFSERANFLLESERENEEFDTSLDQLTNIAIDNNNANGNSDEDKEVAHKLHSRKVSELVVKSTTADDVVKAIKRAQNLHDVHDIREIAHFLLEDVGELLN